LKKKKKGWKIENWNYGVVYTRVVRWQNNFSQKTKNKNFKQKSKKVSKNSKTKVTFLTKNKNAKKSQNVLLKRQNV